MSDTWHHSRASIRRLKAALAEADEDTVYRFAFWVIGIVIMAGAIIAGFGWAGVAFCVGMVFWAAGTSNSQ